MSTVDVLALFELPEPEIERPKPPPDAVLAQLRNPAAVDTAVAGGLGWLTGLLNPAPPPACRSCGAAHVYRTPAGFVLACPSCFPGEEAA